MHFAFNQAARAAALLLLFYNALAFADDDFVSMPGLWKIDTHSQAKTSAGDVVMASEPLWHCVDEDEAPWDGFVMQVSGEFASSSCVRTAFEQGLSTLKWSLRCEGSGVIEGSLVFDTPKHFIGTRVATLADGVRTPQAVKVEGHRLAACTSHLD